MTRYLASSPSSQGQQQASSRLQYFYYTSADGSTIYQVFVDLSKTYDSICCTKLLQLLQGNRMEPTIISIQQQNWEKLFIESNRNVTQGDPCLGFCTIYYLTQLFVKHNDCIQIDDGLISGQS
jgi:hypothetical protein